MNSISAIDKLEFSIEVIRTNRKKSASVQVVDRQVQVIIPQALADERIEQIVRDKTPWIRDKLRKQALLKPKKLKEYVSGEAFSYLGRNYRLKVIQGSSEAVKLTLGKLAVGADADIKQELTSWYMQHAEKRLNEKVVRFAQVMGVVPNSVKVKSYKSRWGSCSRSGDISFHWAIIMAPHYIVDYVVIHELCHMIHHNHSPAFWQQVEKVLPNYRECRDWLKHHGQELKC
ncbi:MAG TPA: M48 family peptidase [Oceanospirillaceae bacterium]|nr:M48 family peptidase [Oceanospirillaceae bacterium]